MHLPEHSGAMERVFSYIIEYVLFVQYSIQYVKYAQ